jgi:hypothetical protein
LHVALGELAQLYSELTTGRDGQFTRPPVLTDTSHRALFEEKLRLFERNTVDALRGSPTERRWWGVRLWHWLLREKPHDPMLKDYFFCSSLPAGVVLLCEPSSRLYLTFPPDARAPEWIADLLVRAEGLYIEIREILRTKNRGICLEMVFAGIVQLIKLMGNEDWRQKQACLRDGASNHTNNGTNGTAISAAPLLCDTSEPPLEVPSDWHMPPWPDLQQTYETQLTQASDLVRRMAQRQAQLDYFYGMVVGAFVLALVVSAVQFVPMLIPGAGLGWLANQLAMDKSATLSPLIPLLWLCPVIGGIGAVVSVMQRMGSGAFALRDRAGTMALYFLGAFRPLIGAVLASAIITLLFTGILPVQINVTPGSNSTLLYCVIAFISGFSERWAQDMLGAGEAALSVGTDAERRAAAT